MAGEVQLIDGGIAIDDRGSVSFANGFSFPDVKRFYLVRNHRAGLVRAWHAHKKERKYVLPVKGACVVAAVAIDDWDNPSPDQRVHRYVLSEHKPMILDIPAGHANGFMSLSDGAALMFFSTSTLEDSLDDDFRYPVRLWDPWNVEER